MVLTHKLSTAIEGCGFVGTARHRAVADVSSSTEKRVLGWIFALVTQIVETHLANQKKMPAKRKPIASVAPMQMR
jgi:hypothetical protein